MSFNYVNRCCAATTVRRFLTKPSDVRQAGGLGSVADAPLEKAATLPIGGEQFADALLADPVAAGLIAMLTVCGRGISRDPLPHELLRICLEMQPEVLVDSAHR